MDNIKNDTYFIQKIRDDLAFIVLHMNEVDLKEFSENEILQDSMMFRLIQISENSKKLTDDYKVQHAFIPWLAIYGLRNRIVHDYGHVNLTVVYDTLKGDIPRLQAVINDGLRK